MENNTEEIGGYFGLELRRGKEYYPNAIKLNSARNCLKYILLTQKPSKIYMPYYMDKSMMEDSLKDIVKYEFYNIDEKFEIVGDIGVKEDEKIVYNNYYSLKDEYVEKLSEKYKNKLIVDNTHSFFSKPLPGIDTVYSLGSKYFGVPGGGYLFTTKILNDEFEQDYSHAKMSHILGRTDKTAQDFFEEFQESKKRRNNQPIRSMSAITSAILSSIDYETVKTIRERNFYYLHAFLKEWNELTVDFSSLKGPMTYPFLITKDNLHHTLIKHKIYVPIYWKEVLVEKSANDFEKKLATYLLPLPIDQRYEITDMKRIVETIFKYIK